VAFEVGVGVAVVVFVVVVVVGVSGASAVDSASAAREPPRAGGCVATGCGLAKAG
jgi:hypothetical protein